MYVLFLSFCCLTSQNLQSLTHSRQSKKFEDECMNKWDRNKAVTALRCEELLSQCFWHVQYPTCSSLSLTKMTKKSFFFLSGKKLTSFRNQWSFFYLGGVCFMTHVYSSEKRFSWFTDLIYDEWESLFYIYGSVHISCLVISNSLQSHRLQHTRLTSSQSLLKLMPIELVMPSNHLIFCHPFLLPPPIFPSIRVFSNESVLRIRWPKYWSFRFRICPSNEYLGLISFRMDWLDLLAVQGTLKSLLQRHSSKASVLWYSAFFMVQLSHPYMTTGKTIALTIWTFIIK